MAVSFDPDGRTVTLLEPFGYVGPDGSEWRVPQGARVDGASIPRIFWSLIGGPFEGRYRNASVIHDWFCDRRTRPWRKVHRTMFDAMIESQVPRERASIMYSAVMHFGPRWSESVVANNNIKIAIAYLRAQEPTSKLPALGALEAALADFQAQDAPGIRKVPDVLGPSDKRPVDPAMEALLRTPNEMGLGTSADGITTTTAIIQRTADPRRARLTLIEESNPGQSDLDRIVASAPKMSLDEIDKSAAARPFLDSLRGFEVPTG